MQTLHHLNTTHFTSLVKRGKEKTKAPGNQMFPFIFHFAIKGDFIDRTKGTTGTTQIEVKIKKKIKEAYIFFLGLLSAQDIKSKGLPPGFETWWEVWESAPYLQGHIRGVCVTPFLRHGTAPHSYLGSM